MIIQHLGALLQAVATFRRNGALKVILEASHVHPILKALILGVSAPLSLFGKRGEAHLPPITRAFSAMTPGYIKLGQTLGTRPDIVGNALAKDLRLLQDSLPAFPMVEAQKIVETAMGKPISAVFLAFEPPIAAASIAQVHPARLQDGRKVAVKILRPNIEAQFLKEVNSFLFIARWLERLSAEMRRLKPFSVCLMLRESLKKELDLRLEAAAADEFAQNTAKDSKFHVPNPVWPLTHQNVMVIEWVDGLPLSDLAGLEQAGIDRKKLAVLVMQSFLRHALRDGYFHADMHQGNLRVSPEGTLIALDFGIMSRLDWFTRRIYAEILMGFLQRDYLRAAKAHFKAGYISPEHSVEDFAQALRAIGERIFGANAQDFSTGDMLAQMFRVTEKFGMETCTELVLLQKTMVVVEGVARELDPCFDIWNVSRPVLKEWVQQNIGPLRIAKEMNQFIEMAEQLSPQVQNLLHQFLRNAQRIEPTEAKLSAHNNRVYLGFLFWIGIGSILPLLWMLFR